MLPLSINPNIRLTRLSLLLLFPLPQLLVRHSQRFNTLLAAAVRSSCLERSVVADSRLRVHERSASAFRALRKALLSLRPDFSTPEALAALGREIDGGRGGGDLPGFLSRRGMSGWTARASALWRPAAEECKQNVARIVLEAGGSLAGTVCGRWKGLRAHFEGVLKREVEAASEKAGEAIEDFLEGEKELFTMNDDALVEAVNKLRTDKFTAAVKAAAASQTDEAAIHKHLVEWYEKREASSEEMAEVLECYWTLSSARFCDNVCTAVGRRLAGERLCGAVQTECLWLGGGEREGGGSELEARLEEVFEEEGEVLELRRELEERRAKLRQAKKLLEAYGGGGGGREGGGEREAEAEERR